MLDACIDADKKRARWVRARPGAGWVTLKRHFEHAELIRRQAKRLALVITLDDAVNELDGADDGFRFAFHDTFGLSWPPSPASFSPVLSF